MCAIGCRKTVAAVVMAIDTRGRDSLIELRQRHREKMESYDTLVGLRVRIRKAGKADNAPVEVSPVDYSAAVERDISRLVETFGLPPILVSDPAVREVTSRM